jgi:DNA (cytosine-5)-methyltransferase 1
MIDIANKPVFKVISLFSGAMGLDIGLEQTGRFDILACCEKDEACLETIKLNKNKFNLKNENIKIYKDIRTLSPKEVLDDLGMIAKEIDVIIGGPPCQSFSTVGKRGTIQDPRGSLIWDYFRFVKEIKPKFFLMENVRGLLSAAIKHRPLAKRGKGNPPLGAEEEPGSVVKLFLSDFEKEGYRVDIFEVNAVNYGAPQLRERVLFIGNNYNLPISFPKPTYVSKKIYEEYKKQKCLAYEEDLQPFRTLGDAIRGSNEENPEIVDFSPRKKKYISLVPPGGNWRSLPMELQKESLGKAFYAKGGRSGWWRRLSYELPCPCLLTSPNHASTSLCHPEEVRALSAKEYAKIQEFPETWEFAGKLIDVYRQIGNAVPVRLGIVSGHVIASYLDEVSESNPPRIEPGAKLTPSRIVHVKSHVRTRYWFKNGESVINGNSYY